VIILKDEQGKVVSTASSVKGAELEAWRIRGRYFTNPVIAFWEDGQRIGQYPPKAKVSP